MNGDKLAETLEDAGLSPYQADAFVTLLERGSASATDIAKASSVPDARIYDVLRDLEEDGYIETYEQDSLHARAHDPSDVLSDLRTRADEFNTAADEIKERWSRPDLEEHKVSIVKRLDTVLARTDELIRSAEDQVKVALTIGQFDELSDALEDAHERGVNVKVCLSTMDEGTSIPSDGVFETACTEEIMHIEANYVRRRGIPGRGSWFTRKNVSGGGSLIDLDVHAIDLSLYILGYPDIDAVSGVTRTEFGQREDYSYLEMWGDDVGPEGFDVDDSTSAFIRCGDNQTISLETAWATNRPSTHEFVVRGTEAAVRFDLLENELSFHSVRSTGPNQFEDSTVRTPENDTHGDEQEAFFSAIADGETVESNVEQALTVQRIIDGIYHSSENGLPVVMNESNAPIRKEPVSRQQ